MTDTFLEDHEEHALAADLRRIAKHFPELLRIARRETSPPGGRAARNPNGYQSRPPVNIAALSTSHELQAVLGGWSQCLTDDAGTELPQHSDTGTLATHLSRHAHQIAQQQWAYDCADEIQHWAKVLKGYTTERAGWEGIKALGFDPTELDEAAADKVLPEKLTIELHFHMTGERLSPATLRGWRKDGTLPQRREHGAAVYSYREVRRALAEAKPRGRHAQRA